MLQKDLFEKIREFVIAGSKLLKSFLDKGERIPFTIEEKYKVESIGSWSMTYERQPLIIDLVLRHEKDLSKLPEFKNCAKLMRADPQVSKHLNKLVGIEGGSKFRRTIWDFLRYFLSPILEKYLKESMFDQQLMRKLYSNFEDFVTSDHISVQVSAYLENFDSDLDKINVQKELVIRRIKTGELERLLQSSKWGGPFASFRVRPPQFIIETAYPRKKAIGEDKRPPPSDSARKLYQLVTALRLFKSGVVGFNEISIAPQTPFLWGSTSSSLDRKTFIGPKYFLGKRDIAQFKDFWSKFSAFSASKHEHLAIAMRRFEHAYERTNPNDKLIDYMIAYEALFFKQGEVGEFRHKLSTRVAKLLDRTYKERQVIAREINEFYGQRSNIVHGEVVRLSSEFVGKVEGYLRDAIKTLMERSPGQDYNELITHLDLD